MPEAERLIRLEERYAHLQKHVGQQDKAMLELAEEVKKLRQELATIRAQHVPGPGEPGETADERPPHY